MKRIVFQHGADEDLIAIFSDIAIDNERAARRVVERLRASVRLLSDYPEMGPLREEFGTGIRSLPRSPYLIFYQVEKDTVRIIRIIHGARDLPGIDFASDDA